MLRMSPDTYKWSKILVVIIITDLLTKLYFSSYLLFLVCLISLGMAWKQWMIDSIDLGVSGSLEVISISILTQFLKEQGISISNLKATYIICRI